MLPLARHAFRWRGPIVALALFVGIGAGIVGSSVFSAAEPFGFSDPEAESSIAYDRLERATGEQALPAVLLLVEPSERRSLKRVAAKLVRVEGVARVKAPASDPRLVSTDGRAAIVEGFLEAAVEDDVADVGERVQAIFAENPSVKAGGLAVASHQLNQTTEEDLRRIELVAAPLLLILLMFVFRGVVAAALPLIVGALSIALTLFALRLLAEVIEIDVFVLNIVTGLGLGLAIDYSLFYVSRYREELEGRGPGFAALEATAVPIGRMVCFSALTVSAALVSLCVFPQRFLYSIGIGGLLVALFSALVVVAVLPSVLAILGERVNSLSLRRSTTRGSRESRWYYRLAQSVMRRPIPVATLTAAAMLIMGLPFLRVELTRADAGVLPAQSSAHQVDSEVRDRFEANPSTSIVVVVEGAGKGSGRARATLAKAPGVGSVSPPVGVSKGIARLDAGVPEDPYSEAPVDAVTLGRSLDWGDPSLVTGPSAELVDQRESLSDHVPVAVAIIVASTILILFAMTRSLILPLLALAMNLLTVSVAFGALVLIFQDGRLEGLLDFTSEGALDTSMPILLFAVAFGLSTDYGVFLLQQVAVARGGAASEREAIATGVARSGPPITAAAILFAVAMGAFAFSELIYVKQVAIGTALAVLIDATLVRGLLFPALLGLLGARAWWAPGRLGR